MREIQHRKEKLNFGKAKAVKVPLMSANKIWLHLIFKGGLFSDRIG
jgi:hypothetical protein